MSLFIPGMDFLASTKLGAAAASTSVLTIPAKDILMIIAMITSYSGSGDIASLRFGTGSGIDTGTNYATRYISYATGGTTATDNASAAATALRLGISTTTGRSAFAIITNPATGQKVMNAHSQIAGSATAVAIVTSEGGGQWNNTTAQITQVQMVTAGGSVTMGIGSGFMVFGRNL